MEGMDGADCALQVGWDRHSRSFSRAVASWPLWDTEGVGAGHTGSVTHEHLLLSSVERDASRE